MAVACCSQQGLDHGDIAVNRKPLYCCCIFIALTVEPTKTCNAWVRNMQKIMTKPNQVQWVQYENAYGTLTRVTSKIFFAYKLRVP